jgi:diacylglycerol kinase (ATP)
MAFVVLSLAFYFRVSKYDWGILLLCIGLVLSLELFNSAVEKLCDLVMPEKHPKIKYIKDVMAAAVLMACLFTAIIGLIIFSQYT